MNVRISYCKTSTNATEKKKTSFESKTISLNVNSHIIHPTYDIPDTFPQITKRAEKVLNPSLVVN